MAVERKEAFDLVGTMVTLVGPELQAGQAAPDFAVVDGNLQPVTLKDLLGKPLVISVVPSLDTGVCAVQTSRFDKESAALGDKVQIVTISVDLPFAQARWCGANKAENVKVLSDYQNVSFGTAYGTLIKEVRLESRAVFVIDAGGTLRYVQYVPKAVEEPDYDAALAALKAAL